MENYTIDREFQSFTWSWKQITIYSEFLSGTPKEWNIPLPRNELEFCSENWLSVEICNNFCQLHLEWRTIIFALFKKHICVFIVGQKVCSRWGYCVEKLYWVAFHENLQNSKEISWIFENLRLFNKPFEETFDMRRRKNIRKVYFLVKMLKYTCIRIIFNIRFSGP